MPEERNNPSPTMDKAAWDEARKDVPREIQAARLIVSRRIGGIPYRPYLNGDCDHAPVVKGVAEFAGLVYDLLDRLDHEPSDIGHNPEIVGAIAEVRCAMEEFAL